MNQKLHPHHNTADCNSCPVDYDLKEQFASQGVFVRAMQQRRMEQEKSVARKRKREEEAEANSSVESEEDDVVSFKEHISQPHMTRAYIRSCAGEKRTTQ
jgi:hypothetical protein